MTTARKQLSVGAINDFKEHLVWQAIVEQITGEMAKEMPKAIDDSDARAAGKVRAYETILGMPDLLLAEQEAKDKPKRKLWR